MPEHPRWRRQSAFTLVELLVVIAIIGVLVALLLPAVQAAREAARRMSCQSSIKNMALACTNYENAKKTYPPGAVNANKASINGSSWQIIILPYMEQGAMSANVLAWFNQWKKTHSDQDPDFYVIRDQAAAGDASAKQLVDALQGVTLYICPSDNAEEVRDKFAPELRASNYGGVAGSYMSRPVSMREPCVNLPAASAYPNKGIGTCVSSGLGNMNVDGMLFPGYGVEGKSIIDGTSNTLMIGERWYQVRAWPFGSYWTSSGRDIPPKDQTIVNSASSACKNINTKYPPNGDPHVVGWYAAHDNATDRPPTKPATVTTGSVAFNDLYFGSFHPGGANFARADASVQFITDGLDLETYGALASRNGEEVIVQP